MYELIEVRKNEVFTNSKIIAEGTENEHHAIRELIKKYRSDIEDFGTLLILNEESSGGRPMEILGDLCYYPFKKFKSSSCVQERISAAVLCYVSLFGKEAVKAVE